MLTDRIDLLISEIDRFVNLSRGGQLAIPGIVEAHLERVEYDKQLGVFKFYPFVRERSATEPKFIVINPALGFGKPVIAGTGISTAVIASGFNAVGSIARSGHITIVYDERGSTHERRRRSLK